MELPAPLELGSTFGWHYTLPHRTTRMTSMVPGVYVSDVTIPADMTGAVPLITFGVPNEAACEALRRAARAQTLSDARFLACPAGLTSLRATYGRYAIVVAADGIVPLIALLDTRPNLLLRLAIILFRYQPAALYLTANGQTVGLCLDRQLFVGRSALPSSNDLVSDLHRFMSCLGHVGSYDLADELSAPISVPSPQPADRADGYWPVPLVSAPNTIDREALERCVDACPSFLLRHKPLWTCIANDWYEHRTILRRYVGMTADVQIHGKVQHGWQSGCGIDGERGYKPEHMRTRFPVFLWNSRNMAAAVAGGVEAAVIGAPFLYFDPPPDPGPLDRGLLCFPYHSVPEYPIATDWHRYADRLHATAKQHGFSRVTVCLHHFDFDRAETREALRSTGVEVTTVGGALEPLFMLRLVHMISEHTAVTSDRICTAGLYAEALGRPFFVSGEVLRSDPPDPDFGLGADREWIAHEMPEFLSFTGTGHRPAAMRELGEEHKRLPDDLRKLLYGWLLDA